MEVILIYFLKLGYSASIRMKLKLNFQPDVIFSYVAVAATLRRVWQMLRGGVKS